MLSERRDDVLGRAGRRRDGGPGGALDLREARLGHGRDIRQGRRSLLSRHRERTQLACLDQRHGGRHRAERDRRMTRDGRADRRAAAAERHMHEVELQRMGEQRTDELRRRAGARRREAVFAGIGPDQRHQLLDALRRHRRIDRQHHRRGGAERDGVEVLERIEAGVAVQIWIVGEVAARHQDGVAVRRRLRGLDGADAARPRRGRSRCRNSCRSLR